MNILYDLSATDPASGGVATVCRWFATRFVSAFPNHNYYAFTDNSFGKPFLAFQKAEAGERILDQIVAERRKLNASVRAERLSRFKDVYRNSPWISPARLAWRSTMAVVHAGQRMRNRWSYQYAAGNFEKACSEMAIDVIHCPVQQIAPIPPHQARSVPYVMNLHDLQHEHFPEFFSEIELERRRTVWYASARASRFVVAAAKHVQEDIVHYTGVPQDRVPLISWGVPFDGELPPGAGQISYVRTRYALPDDFILYPAVTWIHKNHTHLLEAVARARGEGRLNVHLVLTGGSGPWHAEVLRRVSDLGLDPFVRHLGVVPLADLKALYCLATGVVIPSLHEQTSGPLMEAMAMGCPVAGSNIADHPELLAYGSGFLFDPTDVSAIAECIRTLYKERQACKEMAARAKKRINQIRSWRTCAEKYMELYEICREEKSKASGQSSVA